MTQLSIIAETLSDGNRHSSYELAELIAQKKYGGSPCTLIRVGARIWDLTKDGWQIEGKQDKKSKRYWYRATARDGELIFPKIEKC